MIAKTRKQGNNSKTTPKSLILLPLFNLLLKHPLYYTETAIWKFQHWSHDISISIGIIFALQNVLWKNTPQYSSLYLVILHQNPFATVTYFLTNSYPASTKLSDKT